MLKITKKNFQLYVLVMSRTVHVWLWVRVQLQSLKNFQDEALPHELFLTTKQTFKIRNAFTNNMSTEKKISKAQIYKIIRSGRSFGSSLGNLDKKVLTHVAIAFARDNLSGLVSNKTSDTINNFERKIIEKGTVSRKRICFVHFK